MPASSNRAFVSCENAERIESTFSVGVGTQYFVRRTTEKLRSLDQWVRGLGNVNGNWLPVFLQNCDCTHAVSAHSTVFHTSICPFDSPLANSASEIGGV